MKKNAKQTRQKGSPLPFLAGAVALAAAAVLLLPGQSQGDSGSSSDSAALSAGSDLVIRTEEIGTEASYFDYDVEGTTVQVFAVRASDGTVRLALNTCQVCNGSPYAYFEQEEDDFVCQNCGNRFASTAVGRESGGCNPVPITAEDCTEQDGTITVSSSFLEGNAARFANWKRF